MGYDRQHLNYLIMAEGGPNASIVHRSFGFHRAWKGLNYLYQQHPQFDQVRIVQTVFCTVFGPESRFVEGV